MTLHLPTRFDPHPLPTQAPKPRIPKDFCHLKIAIIDDDVYFRTLLFNLLQGSGASIFQAESGASGVHAIMQHQPDIVLMDFMLPDMDGSQVLAAMQADDNLRSIPVIIITSTELDETMQTALQSARAILKKSDLQGPLLLDIVGQTIAGCP